MDAFDTDVLIYASTQGHPLGARVHALFAQSVDQFIGIGSVLLAVELLIKPARQHDASSVNRSQQLLARLDLRELTAPISVLAVEFGARYGLKTVDAVHLATAVEVGADRFITNNRRDFGKDIVEIDVIYPDELPAPI